MMLTPIQEGMLYYYMNNHDSHMYLEQFCFDIQEHIQLEYFKKAWSIVMDNNEMLRTIFRWKKIKKPIQMTLKQMKLPYEYRELSEDSDIEVIKKKDLEAGMDISKNCFRITLCKCSSKYILIISSYHIIFDGWSNAIIINEFIHAYNQLLHGNTPIYHSKNKYKNVIHYHKQKDNSLSEAFWTNYLKGYDKIALLPHFKKKESSAIREVDHYITHFDKAFSDRIRYFIQEYHITVSQLLHICWGLLLQHYSQSNDVIFGSTVSGRNVEVKGIEEIVGLCINTIPIRVKKEGAITIKRFIEQLKEGFIKRLEHENVPLTDINTYANKLGISLAFNSIVVVENYPTNANSNSFNMELNSVFEMTNYDITLVIGIEEGISLRLIYDKEAYDKQHIIDMIACYKRIIHNVMEDPSQSINSIDFISDQEREHILNDFAITGSQLLNGDSISKRIDEQALRNPHHIAIQYKNKSLTYSEMSVKVNQYAHFLKDNGIVPNEIVAVIMEQSIERLIAILAILKVGAGYLPIDSHIPYDRVMYMLDDAHVAMVLTESDALPQFAYTSLQNFESNVQEIKITKKRSHIAAFNQLPHPDRRWINLSRYKGKIGMASVTDCITIQSTRGCPYNCVYCHKIWSKNYVYRDAENIFNEIKYYYDHGVRNFAIIDDCFNLNIENGKKIFQLIIKAKLKINLFFPNGLRGDILTKDFIDLMVEAGTKGINLSLETASPRLQKLLKKNLDLDRFRDNVEYIAKQHNNIILEMATMHGFPSETEEEAMMTLDFIKSCKWIHFPYIHILKIFPNTEMEQFALEYGISKEDILRSKDRAFHELPETLPFSKNFTRSYQASFMKEYFLLKERLEKVIPVQLNILTEEALLQKYNAYLPGDIRTMDDLAEFTKIDLHILQKNKVKEISNTIFERKEIKDSAQEGAMKILLLDLSQFFSSESMLYKVTEQPLGLMYLMTHIKSKLQEEVHGKILKSGVDFDSYDELKEIIDDYSPNLIGIRTLTYFKEFFHQTVAMLRLWGINVPIISGGPYATSDYDTILKDDNVDLIILGEGEITFEEITRAMLHNDYLLPDESVLERIEGIVYKHRTKGAIHKCRKVALLDQLEPFINQLPTDKISMNSSPDNIAYIMYTSGTTGKPKGVLIEHQQVNNCLDWMLQEFIKDKQMTILQRTNITFDPSVWEMFLPLYSGGTVELLPYDDCNNAEKIIQIMQEDHVDMLYCPSSMIKAMVLLLKHRKQTQQLKTKLLLIGAEPIEDSVIKEFYEYYTGVIVNTYGPTECTINNTYYYISRDDARKYVPIGKPVYNNQLYILSDTLTPVPVHVKGTIFVAGDSLARGYINLPEETKKRFIDNPYGKGRLYNTGDIGLWHEDGNIEIKGRTDNQVKIRGYRLELGEIKQALIAEEGISDCEVVVITPHESSLKTCSRCGIHSGYPHITINENNLCNMCMNIDDYDKAIQGYFKNIDELKELTMKSKNPESSYDCVLIYNGGKAAAYALYRLVDMGMNVLAVTCDNGYFSKKAHEQIDMITRSLDVDHVLLTLDNCKEILKISCEKAGTVCRGCFHMSSALATDYARQHNIHIVIGATLSRGQIIENKLQMFLQQGIMDSEHLEKKVDELQESIRLLDSDIFDRINLASVEEGQKNNPVKTIDFYRYIDVEREEIINFLNNKNSCWRNKSNKAIYSTNCPIKKLGDAMFLYQNKYHYYGAATSWEKRIGHMTLKDIEADLDNHVTQKAVTRFAWSLDYKWVNIDDKISQPQLYAYLVSDTTIDKAKIRTKLSHILPSYMIPYQFIEVDNIPLTITGKVDTKALPHPDNIKKSATHNDQPRNEVEKTLMEIWKKVLGVDTIGLHDEFFEVGGNSILLIQLHINIDSHYPDRVSISELFSLSSIAKLAGYLNKDQDGMDQQKMEKLEGIQLPIRHSRQEMDEDQPALQSILEADVSQDIIALARENHVESIDIVLAILLYLASSKFETDNVTIYTAEGTEYIYPITLHMTQYETLSELLHAIEQIRNTRTKVAIRTLIEDIKHEDTLYIFLYDNAQVFHQANNLLFFDMVIECAVSPMGCNLILNKNSSLISYEETKDLYRLLMNAMSNLSSLDDEEEYTSEEAHYV